MIDTMYNQAQLAASHAELLAVLREVLDQADPCDNCNATGQEPVAPDDACSVCGGTGEWAHVVLIPDIRAAIARAEALGGVT